MTNDSPPKREKKETVNPVKYIPDNNHANSTGDKGVKKLDKLYEMTNQRWASNNTEDKTMIRS